jgi:hypothetical protein
VGRAALGGFPAGEVWREGAEVDFLDEDGGAGEGDGGNAEGEDVVVVVAGIGFAAAAVLDDEVFRLVGEVRAPEVDAVAVGALFAEGAGDGLDEEFAVLRGRLPAVGLGGGLLGAIEDFADVEPGVFQFQRLDEAAVEIDLRDDEATGTAAIVAGETPHAFDEEIDVEARGRSDAGDDGGRNPAAAGFEIALAGNVDAVAIGVGGAGGLRGAGHGIDGEEVGAANTRLLPFPELGFEFVAVAPDPTFAAGRLVEHARDHGLPR